MTLYQVLSLFGAGGLLVGVFRLLFAQIKGVRLGVQALLRAQMIADYNIPESSVSVSITLLYLP